MRYNPLIHHRKSIRLKGYDYSGEGMYYVTVPTHDRQEIFGSIADGIMLLSDAGRIVQEEWLRTPFVRLDVSLDEYVIMPDHVHGIIVINDERNGDSESLNNPDGAYCNTPQRDTPQRDTPQRDSPRRETPFRSPSRTLGAIMRGFKGASTKRINEQRGTPGAKVWQRNYYEHIVRDGKDLDRIRRYIRKNIEAWMLKEECS